MTRLRAVSSLYEICMPARRFGRRPVRDRVHHGGMDAVAILIAVAFIGLTLVLLKGIERI